MQFSGLKDREIAVAGKKIKTWKIVLQIESFRFIVNDEKYVKNWKNNEKRKQS